MFDYPAAILLSFTALKLHDNVYTTIIYNILVNLPLISSHPKDDTQRVGWSQATYEQYVGDLKLKLEKQVPSPGEWTVIFSEVVAHSKSMSWVYHGHII